MMHVQMTKLQQENQQLGMTVLKLQKQKIDFDNELSWDFQLKIDKVRMES
jgi:hypothetical protein